MSDVNMRDFDKRMERILRKHQRLARGYVPAITDDGLIVARPKRSLRLPWRSVLFLLVVGFGFKVFLYASMGPEAYELRVTRLAAGTQMEQIGAWAMAADPVTVAVSERIAGILD